MITSSSSTPSRRTHDARLDVNVAVAGHGPGPARFVSHGIRTLAILAEIGGSAALPWAATLAPRRATFGYVAFRGPEAGFTRRRGGAMRFCEELSTLKGLNCFFPAHRIRPEANSYNASGKTGNPAGSFGGIP